MEKTQADKKSIVYKLLLVLIFFNIWFPKAGIKLSGIPITVSNVVFFAILIIWLLSKFKNKIKISKRVTITILLSIAYFILKYILIFCGTSNIMDYITYIIPLIVYPLIFIVIFDEVDTKEKLNDIVKVVYYGFFVICIYSLAQFIFGIEKTAIPGLTVNLTDYNTYGSTWFMQKSNGTDIANAKIVSTYQNGNLLGINLILIYPMIYMMLKKQNKNKQLIVSLILFIICGFLTLSRTCWLGIVLFLFMGIVLDSDKTKKSFMKKVLLIFLFILSIILVFNYMPIVSNRFLNTHPSDWIKMSGRTAGLTEVLTSVRESNSLLAYIIGPEGVVEYSGLAYEMFPLAVFVQVGIIGIVLMYSVYVNGIKKINKNTSIGKGIRLSIIIWLIVGLIECGYWLPPTAMNLFIILAIGSVVSQKNIEGDSL